MHIKQLADSLFEESTRNDSLHLLLSILEGQDEDLIDALAALILEPEKITDTNRFAVILVKMPSDKYIQNLMSIISSTVPDKTPWLGDYMYALIDILQEKEECIQADESFVNLIGNWIFTNEGGEISWKAGDILINLGNPSTKPFFFKGAVDNSLLHLTRIACLRGIINHYRSEAGPIIEILIHDQDKHVKEEAIMAKKWLQSESKTESNKEI